MDITTLAAWGEFIGGIAVVISLVYLASQIRQNSKLLRASTGSATAQIAFSQNAMTVQDPEVARISLDGFADRASLSDVDRRRFDSMVHLQLKGNWQLFRLYRDGISSHQEWRSCEREMSWAFQQPGQRAYWSEWCGLFEEDFADFVNGLIREGDAAG